MPPSPIVPTAPSPPKPQPSSKGCTSSALTTSAPASTPPALPTSSPDNLLCGALALVRIFRINGVIFEIDVDAHPVLLAEITQSLLHCHPERSEAIAERSRRTPCFSPRPPAYRGILSSARRHVRTTRVPHPIAFFAKGGG